jgi:hypothetical protein
MSKLTLPSITVKEIASRFVARPDPSEIRLPFKSDVGGADVEQLLGYDHLDNSGLTYERIADIPVLGKVIIRGRPDGSGPVKYGDDWYYGLWEGKGYITHPCQSYQNALGEKQLNTYGWVMEPLYKKLGFKPRLILQLVDISDLTKNGLKRYRHSYQKLLQMGKFKCTSKIIDYDPNLALRNIIEAVTASSEEGSLKHYLPMDDLSEAFCRAREL